MESFKKIWSKYDLSQKPGVLASSISFNEKMAHLRETYEDAQSITEGIIKVNSIINQMNKDQTGYSIIYCIHGPVTELEKFQYQQKVN
jgi:hypothetical protein